MTPDTYDNVIQLHVDADEPIVGEVADLVCRYGYEEVAAEVALHMPLRPVKDPDAPAPPHR